MSRASRHQVWSRMLGVAIFAAQFIGSAAPAQRTGLRMPRVIGLDTSRAIGVLRVYRRVRWTTVPPIAALVPIDSIVDQRPLPDSLLRLTDTVRLYLGGRAVVPQLVGHTEAEVTRLLEAARLRGRPDSEPATADSEIHRVVRQSLSSGALVPPFSVIAFWLGTDRRSVAVVTPIAPVDTTPRRVPPLRPRPSPVVPPPPPPPPHSHRLAIALSAIALVLVAGTLAARAAWLATVTSTAELGGYPPRITVDEPPLIAGDVALRARVETYPSRVSIPDSRSLLA